MCHVHAFGHRLAKLCGDWQAKVGGVRGEDCCTGFLLSEANTFLTRPLFMIHFEIQICSILACLNNASAASMDTISHPD